MIINSNRSTNLSLNKNLSAQPAFKGGISLEQKKFLESAMSGLENKIKTTQEVSLNMPILMKLKGMKDALKLVLKELPKID